MLAAMRVKSPFSQSALFGFVEVDLFCGAIVVVVMVGLFVVDIHFPHE
jgi:hypothetical protein